MNQHIPDHPQSPRRTLLRVVLTFEDLLSMGICDTNGILTGVKTIKSLPFSQPRMLVPPGTICVIANVIVYGRHRIFLESINDGQDVIAGNEIANYYEQFVWAN